MKGPEIKIFPSPKEFKSAPANRLQNRKSATGQMYGKVMWMATSAYFEFIF